MFTHALKLEVRGANDRIYTLLLSSPESPLGEINDALSTMKNVVIKQIQDQHDAECRKNEEAKEQQEECCKPNEECSKQYEECKEPGE